MSGDLQRAPRAPFTKTVEQLDTSLAFPGVKELERRRGRPYRARLGANECLFGVSPRAMRALRQHANEVAFYADPTHRALRHAISVAWGLSEEHFVVAEGIEGLLALFVRAFIEQNDVAVTSRGTYPSLEFYVKGCGGRVFCCPYKSSASIDLEGLLTLAKRHRAKLIYLVNPDNPTGQNVTVGEILYLLDHLPDECMLILDEAYAEFLNKDNVLAPKELPPNLIRFRSFSKAYGLAGARIAYAAADPAVLWPLSRIKQHYAVSRLSEELALAAFSDHEFLARVLAQTAEGREHYFGIARQIGVATIPSSTNFVAFDFEITPRAKLAAEILEQHDIFVHRPSEQPLDRLVRITIGPPDDRAYLAEVLQRMALKQ